MYLLYLDESGTQPSARHLILAGVALHEDRIHWATDQLNDLQRKYFPDLQQLVQFHTTSLRARENDPIPPPFDQLDRPERFRLLSQLYEIANGIFGTFFAVVVEKAYLESQDPYARALEEVLSRFDHFLNRMYRERNQRDKGLIVIADSEYRERLELLAGQLAVQGTRWGELYNLVDIPFFTLSRNSRLLQMADLISNTVFGRYETGHAVEFDRMLRKFDQDDSGRMHGLVHLCRERNLCYLPCCLSRRTQTTVGAQEA